jgi:hypothetical protein
VLKFNNYRENRFLRNQTAGRHIPNTKIFINIGLSIPTQKIGKRGQTENLRKEYLKREIRKQGNGYLECISVNRTC